MKILKKYLQNKEKNNQIESVSFHNNQLFLESRESKIVINVGSSNLICVSVDGSDHSDLAFDLVTKEFLGSVIILTKAS